MNALLVFLACLAVFGVLWLTLIKKKPAASPPASTVYICNQCGSQDCDCHPETPEKKETLDP